MRNTRQNKILELIQIYEIETQDKLVALLRESGFDTTQATISRDIKELHLLKALSSSGRYKYCVGTSAEHPVSDRFINIFKETIQSVTASENIVLLKTLSGCASAAAEAIDSLGISHVLGTIAGDNTILLVADSTKNVPELMEKFTAMIG